ncbi:hypothetical protein MFIFM68171_01673 [Madurella fahalii]|uniref:DUF983 domain-containing protein n=1 Tax=Madurella fahalii TaxID=1157608 RepID=A0ABQ0G138_9PEZI
MDIHPASTLNNHGYTLPANASANDVPPSSKVACRHCKRTEPEGYEYPEPSIWSFSMCGGCPLVTPGIGLLLGTTALAVIVGLGRTKASAITWALCLGPVGLAAAMARHKVVRGVLEEIASFFSWRVAAWVARRLNGY